MLKPYSYHGSRETTVTKYKPNPGWLVEPFRKADWGDATKGRWRFGLSSAFVTDVMSMLPNVGFHKRWVALTKQRLRGHPFSPLPKMRL